MKPTDERYQAAVQTNALSPEIMDIEEADSLRGLEGSIELGVMASLTYFSGIVGSGMVSKGLRWNLGEPLRSLRKGTFLVCAFKQPGPRRSDTRPEAAPRIQGYRQSKTPTSRKGKEVSKAQRQSDTLIVVMKRGNACGAKGRASLCKVRGSMSQTQIWSFHVNGI